MAELKLNKGLFSFSFSSTALTASGNKQKVKQIMANVFYSTFCNVFKFSFCNVFHIYAVYQVVLTQG